MNFTAVPIINLIDRQLIHNNGCPATPPPYHYFLPQTPKKNWKTIVAAISLIRETLEFGLRGALGVAHELLVLSLHQEMFRRHQGLVLDNCKNKYRHKYKSTWIIALAMNRRRRILLVFMTLSIGCYCHFITPSWKITSQMILTSNKIINSCSFYDWGPITTSDPGRVFQHFHPIESQYKQFKQNYNFNFRKREWNLQLLDD